MTDDGQQPRSWREDVSATGQQQLDSLFDFAVSFAARQLEAHGVLAPFGAVVTIEGEQKAVGIMPSAGVQDAPNSSELLIDEYRTVYRADRDQLSSTMIACDVRVPQLGGDAIAVHLESREGVAMTWLVPYRLKGFGRRKIALGEITGSPDAPTIWTDASA